ncbi:DUF4189 domain-containing protein [Nocardia sp. NPDC052001]|uniref:DUF4189 domain-containing protein n=1 Tax=Nocardia sp. NPDC052001 TaxID=3154853 RepID=UPI0034344FBF
MSFFGKAVVAVATVGLVAGSAVGAGVANAVAGAVDSGLFGAIAFSKSEWSYGTSVDAVSGEAAVIEALDNCAWDGATDCVVLAHWADGCGALAYASDDTSHGVSVGVGDDRDTALSRAYLGLARRYPRALLANTGSADLSEANVSEVVCTSNV